MALVKWYEFPHAPECPSKMIASRIGGIPLVKRWLLAAAVLLVPLPTFSQEKKPLRWGTDPTGGAPYVYQDAAGNFIGFEVDLADYLAAKIGRTSVMKKGDWDKLPELLGKPADNDGEQNRAHHPQRTKVPTRCHEHRRQRRHCPTQRQCRL